MKTLIEATDLSYAYGAQRVLERVSFTVEAGEPVALIGPNGAGKTTLFSLICGYLPLQSGRLQVLGEKAGSSALAGRLGALPQDALFDPAFSLQSQLSFYGRLQGLSKVAAQQEAERVLSLVGLAQHSQQLPTSLSHGMRKRLSIAQALLGSPELVLLDEPTAGLDPVNAMQIRQLIANLSGQATFLISSHNIFELERLCGTVLYLEKGVLVRQGALTQQAAQQAGCSYLTVVLESPVPADVSQWFSQLPGVTEVQQVQKHEYQLAYNPDIAADVDLQLLQLLAGKGWRYRQLSKGLSLEQQLFSDKTRRA